MKEKNDEPFLNDEECLGKGISGCLVKMIDGSVMDVTPGCKKHYYSEKDIENNLI